MPEKTVDGFNLQTLIREVCDGSLITDPGGLAKEVGRRIGRNQQVAALQQALPILVQHHVSRHRTAIPEQRSEPASSPSRSRKVAGIREAWRRMLGDRVAVGPDPSDWKFLGDCTADDLDYAAGIREEHARRNTARAVQLRRLAEQLEEHGVERVVDLPEPVLAASLVSTP